ncbi:MAG: MmcQ/YjbR family DNA-binding protein [Bacillota bacterium]
MNIETFREYCLSKKGVTETYPFDEVTMVMKVMNKMFALASLESIPLWINLKCEPEKCIELREKYESVQPGYHMNKTYWNTIIIDNTISDKVILQLIDHSYDQVVKGLKKKDQEILSKL